MKEPITILHLEDSKTDTELLKAQLNLDGIAFNLIRVDTEEKFTQELNSGNIDIILSDYTLPSFNGKEALILAQKKTPNIPFLFLSGTMGEEIAVKSLLDGAKDYITKDNLTRITPSIKNALNDVRERFMREKAETALMASESKFRELFNNMSSGVAIYEATDNGNDFIFLDLNKAGQISSHVNIDEIRGNRVTNVFPGIREIGLLEIFKRVWITGEPEILPGVLYKDDRISQFVENYVYKLPSGQIVAVYDDITERKNTELKLREGEERYRTLFENMLDGFALHEMIFDNNNIPIDYRFLEINPAFENLTGLKAKDIIGKTVLEVMPDTEEYWIKTYGNVVLTGEPYRFENYSKALDKYFEVVAFSPTQNKFATIFTDITERKNSEAALINSEHELRSLNQHLQTIREEERASIAREIHDELGQVLTSIKMNISIIGKEISSKKNIDIDYVKSEFDSIAGIIDSSVIRLRKLITELRPELLDKLGLIPAIEWQIEEFQKLSEIKCGFHSNISDFDLDPSKAIVVYRVLQEALTNIGRHSGATKANIDFELKNNTIKMEIRDNGKGFSVNKLGKGKSFGVIGMRERAASINGSFNIISGENKGTNVILSVPIE